MIGNGFAPEYIINANENFKDKLAYYDKTYDNNLNHRFAKGMRICGCTYGETFKEIEDDLYQEVTQW